MSKKQYLAKYHDQARQHIQPIVLIDRLVSHVLGDVDMTPSQVTAALGLIKKVLPDVTAMDISMLHETGPETLKRIERVVIDAVAMQAATGAIPGESTRVSDTEPNWLN